MGIKFHCPNGHKVHVKAFLAGKRGKCPKCGVAVRIPTAAEVGGVADDDIFDDDGVETIETLAAGAVELSTTNPTPAVAQRTEPPSSPPPPPILTTPPPSADDDPILAAPDAKWYVTIASGERFGPARGELLRQWIDERRLTADSLVWREGWSDWKRAGEVLPDFRESSLPLDELAGLGSLDGPVVATTSPALQVARQRRKTGMQSASFLLLAAAVLLGLVLIIVLWAPWR